MVHLEEQENDGILVLDTRERWRRVCQGRPAYEHLLDVLAQGGQNMGQFSLTVCVAAGDFGIPAAVGVATNERVMSDGAALVDDVIAPAIGVGVVIAFSI